MEKKIQIVPDAQPGKELNKAQKQFNSLVRKIEQLRHEIIVTRDLDNELRRLGDEMIKPIGIKATETAFEWIMVLHNHPAKGKLSNKMAEKFKDVMRSEIQSTVFTSPFYEGNEEIETLYATYEGSGRTFEEIEQEEDLEVEKLAHEMMEELFGFNMGEMGGPEGFQEFFQKKEAEFQEQAQKRREKRDKRKKTDAQIAAEEKRKAAADAVHKTTRQIYHDLVRHFHPDKEPDETKRAEKTSLMQQITAAYDENDHLKLLELQITLLSDRTNVFAEFDSQQLKYFNKMLQEQVGKLQFELTMASPEMTGNLYSGFFNPNRKEMLRNIEQHKKGLKKLIKDLGQNITYIRSEKEFKTFVNEYEFWF